MRSRICRRRVAEALEPRRLLCTIGAEEPAETPVHVFDDGGRHLDLTLIPDASAVDVIPRLIGPRPAAELRTAGAAEADDDGSPQAEVSAPTGSLNGKIVYMNAGHGWTWNGSSWVTQRPEYQEMVEDLTTQDQITYYAQYLLNAGATVVPTRPLGHQTSQVIVDNNDAGFSIQSGSWSTNSASSTYWSNVNGTDTANRYRFANVSATETAVARFTPNIPSTGFYPVYAWYNNGSNRSTEVTYRVNSANGSQEVKVNQRYTGKGWVFLGIHYFEAGTGGNVEVSNRAPNGSAVIADSVRFGNGMGDWRGDENPSNPVSGKPREEELSLYWLYRSRGFTGPGAIVPTSTVDGGNASDSSGGIVGPPRWVSYMNDETQGTNVERLHISVHSNGTTGLPDASARGTLALLNNNAAIRTMNQEWWANAMAEEIEEDMQALPAGMIEHTWASRANVYSSQNYGEINNDNFDAFNTDPNGNDVTASTILEVLFHDNLQDSQLMRDPKVRDWVARSTYQATVKYFNTFAGGDPTLLPDPPTAVRTTTDAQGRVTLNWTAPGSGAANGGAGAATGYKIYYGTSGYTWSDVVTVGNVTSHTFNAGTLPAGQMTYFKVVATNAGGESLQRDVVAAKTQVGRRAPILIVNGFDRFDRTTNDTQSWSGNNNVTERPRLRYQNTRDYAVKFAEAVEAFNPGLGVETAQNEHVVNGAVNLANYHTVLWISGEESTVHDTFDATEQSLITSYLAGGGKFFASGSEIGWDLDQNGGGAAFYNNQLRADFVNDDADSYATTGVPGSAFASVGPVNFDNGAGDAMGAGTYDVDQPDVINPTAGASAALTYSTGGTAAVQHASGNTKVVTMGFPFETITTADARNAVMAGVLNFFNANSTFASPAPTGIDLLAASDTGSSSTDNVTSRDNSSPAKSLSFSVSGTVPGATVTVYFGSIAVGTTTASAASTTVTTSGTLDIPDGSPRSFTARQTEPGKSESADSPALDLTIDTVAPTADVVDVSPDPRGTSVSSIAITFSLAVNGFNLADLSLTRNGGSNLLTASQTLTSGDNVSFTLGNLAGITNVPGTYVLTLAAAGSGISTLAGNSLAANAADTWVNNNAAPTIASMSDVPDPIAPGGTLGLTANSVTDPNGTAGLVVNFYRESNGTPGLQVGGDTLVHTDTTNPFSAQFAAPTTPGMYTYYAQATDTGGLTSGVVSTTNTVSAPALPAWLAPGSAANWDPATKVLTVTGPATIIADPGADLPIINAAAAAAVLTINPASDLNVHIGALNLSNGARAVVTSLGASRTAANHRVLVIDGAGLSIGASSKLDLTDNDLRVEYAPSASPLDDVQDLLASGYGPAGDWLGATGLTSSTAAADSRFSLGVADDSALGTVLVKFTWTGDLNLDGRTDFADLSVFNGNYDSGASTNRLWIDGDLTFDGLMNFADLSLFNGSYDPTKLQL